MLAINPAQAPDMARKYGGLAQGMLDRRTREWRRRQELVDMFTQALGGADTLTLVTLSKVQTAAELSVAAELTRVRFMAGENISPDDVVRTANQAARAEKALGIGTKASTAPLTLRERMMQEQQA
ncbi:hypothetical protein [Mesorhizobium sp. M0138]|uniref:hypothetical protein n=1 Tax=Mesorhizobium sp. M0138 TaxID=2956891 RepID=UPI0033392AFF